MSPPTVTEIAGPQFIGYLFNVALYGCLVIQICLYYLAFPKDSWLPKSLVACLFALETMQTIIVFRDAFATYSIGFADPEILNDVQTTWLSVPLLSGVVSCLVQLFFAYRIHILARDYFVASGVAAIALMQCGAAIASGVQALQVGKFSELQFLAFKATTVWLVGSAVCDVLIAASMIFYLSRRNTGFRSTHALIIRLMKMVVETGATTATVATLDVILFLGIRDRSYHTVPALILAKLYSNTCLAVLNSRMHIIGGRNANSNDHDIQNTSTYVANSGSIRIEGVSMRKDVWTDGTTMGAIKDAESSLERTRVSDQED
ncbi:hypothetical protein AX16_007598 [Volvariella volvacea WC 439]|nr:hypothetical protein AX16_007598 [Volvariella volvacea WC 439]